MKLNEQKSLMLSLALAVMTTAAWAGEGFSVVQSTRQIPERGEVKSANITDGKMNASFILPVGWRLGNDGKAVVLQSQDFGTRIEVRHAEKAPAANESGMVMNQYSLSTPAGQAQVVDSKEAVEGSLRLAKRTVSLDRESHTLQITISGSPESVSKHQKAFENFVGSFRFS